MNVSRRTNSSVRPQLADLALIAAWFTLSRLVCWQLGVRPDSFAPESLWQVLPLEDLASRPVEALWYLHAQPPLFNALIALFLRLPGDLSIWLRLTWLGFGLAMPVLLFAWFRLATVPRWPCHALVLLFGLNPTLVLYENFFFYSYPEALCLLGALYGLAVCPSRPVLFAMFASVLVAFRAMFHPAWALAVALLAYRSLDATSRKRALPWLMMPLAVGLVLVLKNGIMFGVWSTSSWFGSNIARLPAIVLENAAAELHGRQVVSQAFVVGPFRAVERYPAELVAPSVREATDRFGPDHVLLRERKSNGEPNYNHVAYIPISRQLARDAWAAFEARPRAVLEGVADGVRSFLAPASAYGFLNENRRRLAAPEGLFRAVLFPFNSPWLILLTIATCVGSAIAVLARRPMVGETLRAPAAYFCLTLIWVTGVANVMEFGENNRFRFSIDPLLYAWLVVVLWTVAGYRPAWPWASRAQVPTAAVPASFAALAIVVTAISVWRAPSPGPDVVGQLDREFRQLLPHLPRTGVIGYLDPPEGSDVVDEQRPFYAAQFSLAPLVIVRRQEPEFVIVPRGHALRDDPRLAGLFVYGTTSAGHRVYRRLTP